MNSEINPSVIDFEASGFGAESYPVEVGIITSTGERYCSMIRPHEKWRFWDNNAEAMHGISRELLEKKGRPIVEVCHELNAFANNSVLYSDAWVHDKPWLIKLFEYGAVEVEFTLSPIESIVTEQQLEIWDEVKQQITHKLDFIRHRASNDALIIQQTFQETRRLNLNRHGDRALSGSYPS